jgi:hypothetical protein
MSPVMPTQLSGDETDAAPVAEPESPPERPAGRYGLVLRILPDLLAAGAFIMAAAVMLGYYWGDVPHRVSNHLPDDHIWFEWLLAHGAYSVRHLSNPLFSMRQNVPLGVNMMANTSALGVSIPLAPLTMLVGPKITYLLWLGGAPALTAFTSYWVLSRNVVKSRVAAAVGGAFIGFAPGVVHHANGQPNFLSNFVLPFIVLRVMRLGEQGRWLRNGIILGLLVTYQAFINEEQLLITAMGCVVAVLVYSAMRRREALDMVRPFLAAAGVTTVIVAALLAYPLWWQFNGPQTFTAVPFNGWGEDVRAFFTFSRDTLAGDASTETSIGMTEQNSWYGIPLFCLVAVLVAVLWRSVIARTAAITGAVFATLALGANIRWSGHITSYEGPWALVPEGLPVLSMLSPTRMIYVGTLAIGLLLALGWDKVAQPDGVARPLKEWFRFDARLAVAIALIPLIPTPLPVRELPSIPTFITSEHWRSYVPEGQTLVPVPVPSRREGVEGLQWSAVALHEFAIPAGYFLGPGDDMTGMLGPKPRPTQVLFDRAAITGKVPVITELDRALALDDLRFWRAAVLVVSPSARQDTLRLTLDELFGPGQRVDDVWLWDVRDLVRGG